MQRTTGLSTVPTTSMKSSLPTNKEALVAAVNSGTKFEYFFFWGHRKSADGVITKSCFSQWYEAAFQVDGELFRTSEHYMMVHKARLFSDNDTATAMLAASTPDEAKSLGRKVSGFLDEVWLQHREEIVFAGNVAKFTHNHKLRTFLLGTGTTVLVEASPVDPIWGIGLAKEDPLAIDPPAWPGLNLLGFALMKTRDHLRTGA